MPSEAPLPILLEPGQIWTAKSVEPTSIRIQIGSKERMGDYDVISVLMFDVPCPASMGMDTMTISHAPFEASILAAGLDQLEAVGAATPDHFEEGYATWKSERGGFWTLGPVEVARMIVDTIASQGLQ